MERRKSRERGTKREGGREGWRGERAGREG